MGESARSEDPETLGAGVCSGTVRSGEGRGHADDHGAVPADGELDIGQVDTLDASGTITPDAFLAEVGRIPERTSTPSDAPALQPGDSLGRFVVRAEIGRGGMGVVYAAADPTLGREVALKVLPKADDEERRRRFLREARAAAAIADPGIATIYDVGEDAGRVFIAMELVRGRTLRAVLDARAAQGSPDRALPVGETLRIVREIACALATAHARGVVHRDLKPENVMIAEDGHLKLLDFGIAKHTSSGIYDCTAGTSSSEIGRILGTPSYMSPEQAKGRAVDARSDVFSLGVMLFEMVTGRRPFDRATLVEMFVALDRDEPPAPSRLNARVPAALERVILRCLRKDPAARYADARALLHELETISVARPPSRARVFVAAAVAVLAMGVVALAATRPPTYPAPPASAPSVVVSEAPVVATPVTALPAPTSTSAEALAAYREGVISARTGEGRGSPFSRAIELDPTFAAAHLRMAEGAFAEARPDQREHFRVADEHRAALSERDRGLLDAVEPMVRRQPADWREANRRILALLERFPGDAELWFLLGNGTVNFADFEAGRRYYTRATELDPSYARAFSSRAMAEAYLGRFADARRSVDHCLAVSPASGSCLVMMARLQSSAGDCEGVEASARHMIAGGSQPGWAYSELAGALAARDQPISVVREALRQAGQAMEAMKGVSAEDRDCYSTSSTAHTEILAGQFDAAEKTARVYEKLVAGKLRQDEHGAAALEIAQILEEEGRQPEAARVALDFLDRRDAWEPNPGAEDVAMANDATPSLLAVALHGGSINRAELAARRAPWLKAWSARVTPVARNFLWPHAWARAVDSADEAREALAAQPKDEVLPPFSPASALAADIGHTFLLGGRVDDAVSWLEQATRVCDVLRQPIERTRAQLWLGQAREARGDTTGACAAYKVVIRRWGKATPKSVTADKAKERARALRCPT
jgi:serine/threonine-protein kinase